MFWSLIFQFGQLDFETFIGWQLKSNKELPSTNPYSFLCLLYCLSPLQITNKNILDNLGKKPLKTIQPID